jgi:hypothetical protein
VIDVGEYFYNLSLYIEGKNPQEVLVRISKHKNCFIIRYKRQRSFLGIKVGPPFWEKLSICKGYPCSYSLWTVCAFKTEKEAWSKLIEICRDTSTCIEHKEGSPALKNTYKIKENGFQ